MVSAAEQLAANLKFSTFAKADELKQRLLFTLGALLIYRFGTFIPIPGIDTAQLAKLFEGNPNTVFGMLNVFSGGVPLAVCDIPSEYYAVHYGLHYHSAFDIGVEAA